MQKLLFIIGSFIAVLFTLLFPLQSPLDARVASNGQRLAQVVEGHKVMGGQVQITSCAAPDKTEAERCQQLEAAILDVTLRLEISVKTLNDDGSGGPTSVSVGHATVVDGRFLVTHNHFAQSPDKQHASQLLTISAYRADGSLAINQAPPHVFQVFIAGPQTLVFDFGQYGGQGAFDYMGMASAQLATWQALGLRPGAEVAQVNWDGQKTYIDWVHVSSIGLENGTPVLQLDNYVEPGASGGGVFYAGYHVGNNWFRDIDKQFITGKTLRKWTVAALNETSLITVATGAAEPALTEAAPLPNGGSLLNLAGGCGRTVTRRPQPASVYSYKVQIVTIGVAPQSVASGDTSRIDDKVTPEQVSYRKMSYPEETNSVMDVALIPVRTPLPPPATSPTSQPTIVVSITSVAAGKMHRN